MVVWHLAQEKKVGIVINNVNITLPSLIFLFLDQNDANLAEDNLNSLAP